MLTSDSFEKFFTIRNRIFEGPSSSKVDFDENITRAVLNESLFVLLVSYFSRTIVFLFDLNVLIALFYRCIFFEVYRAYYTRFVLFHKVEVSSKLL